MYSFLNWNPEQTYMEFAYDMAFARTKLLEEQRSCQSFRVKEITSQNSAVAHMSLKAMPFSTVICVTTLSKAFEH